MDNKKYLQELCYVKGTSILREQSELRKQNSKSSLRGVGRHNDVPDSKFDSEQIKKGLKVECEHSDDPKIQLAIVKDHLSECNSYYTFLEEMEQKCKGNN